MNRDEVKGKAQTLKGKVKQGIGRAVDDSKLRGKGTVDEAAGRTQETFGRARRKAGEAVKGVGDALKGLFFHHRALGPIDKRRSRGAMLKIVAKLGGHRIARDHDSSSIILR